MRFLLATCPTDPPAHLLFTIPGDGEHDDPIAWTPLPCWVPGRTCPFPHPLTEHPPATIAGFLRSVAHQIDEPDSGPLVASPMSNPVPMSTPGGGS